MTAPHDGARGDARKRHDAPTCLVCGNSVPVDASALAAAKAEGRTEGLREALEMASAERAAHLIASTRAPAAGPLFRVEQAIGAALCGAL